MKSKKEEWTIFEWPGYHLYQAFAPIKAWYYDFKKFNCSLNKIVLIYSKGTTCFCFLKKEYEENGAILFNKILKKPAILSKILSEINRSANSIYDIGKKWENINFSEISNKKLIQYHKRLFFWDEILWRKGQIQNILELNNHYLTDYVKKLVRNKYGKNKESELFSILTVSNYETVAEKQSKDLFELARNIKRKKISKQKYEKMVKAHSKKYLWMNYGWEGPALSENYFTSLVRKLVVSVSFLEKLRKSQSEKRKKIDIQKKLLNTFSLSEKNLIILLRKLLEAKSKRVDAHSLTYYYADKMLSEISKRTCLSLNQLRVVPPSEIYRLFNKVNSNQLNQEYNLVIYWYERGKELKKYTGSIAKRKFLYIKSTVSKIRDSNLLKGEIAYPGLVIGKVRVILKHNEFINFKNKEILVTRMTDPAYVPFMKKAKAIVTDIGGITSHAAIVSRELGIPCVIGTKIATQVLKDGDLVEVDANKGIVRKLQ